MAQIKKILPRNAWDGVIIEENNEPLILLKSTDRLKTGLIKKDYTPSFLVRKSVEEKLYRVSENLPKGIILVVIEGYRTLKEQQNSWDRKFQKLKVENPSWTDEEIEKQVRLVVAKPNPLANHHCGGAVDVTLAYQEGALLDMGSFYPSEAMSFECYKKFQMLSSQITEEQKANRKILRDAMEKEDFVWYPGEWWHYSWGDRMWAVYSKRKKCFYAGISIKRNEELI